MQFNINYHDAIFEVTTSGDAILPGYYDFTKAVLEHNVMKCFFIMTSVYATASADTINSLANGLYLDDVFYAMNKKPG